ncbi:unnamed protein product [Rhizoctonia solani]|uniref:BTB domain-containing protein n=1 Tax=Rhizoctonia solani TaxID=456999 RepID=A0A8H3C4E6_9AGAM|nr:unnamed protein product [Rhizoctonia solani]
MSQPDNTGNNQAPPLNTSVSRPSTSSTMSSSLGPNSAAKPQNRDTKFYYRDGSAVFLAGNKLFKFQASLLAADPDVKDYEFKPMIKDVIDSFEPGIDKPGTSDALPIVLPADITAPSFRRFLIVVFGG